MFLAWFSAFLMPLFFHVLIANYLRNSNHYKKIREKIRCKHILGFTSIDSKHQKQKSGISGILITNCSWKPHKLTNILHQSEEILVISSTWFLTLLAPGGGGGHIVQCASPVTYLRISVQICVRARWKNLTFLSYEFGKGQYTFYPVKLSRFLEKK